MLTLLIIYSLWGRLVLVLHRLLASVYKINFYTRNFIKFFCVNPIQDYLLRSMPPRDSMDMGKGYDDMISCATCSLSQCLMQKVLLSRFILVVSLCFSPHVYRIVKLWTCINSIATLMYPYALPILLSLILSQDFALVTTWAQA